MAGQVVMTAAVAYEVNGVNTYRLEDGAGNIYYRTYEGELLRFVERNGRETQVAVPARCRRVHQAAHDAIQAIRGA